MPKKQTEVKDYFDRTNEQLSQNLIDKAKALELDLEKYKSLEDTTDKDLREMHDLNRALLSTVIRQRDEITNLKIEVDVLKERIPPHPDDFP